MKRGSKIPVIKEIQTKTRRRYQSLEWLDSKGQLLTSAGENVEKLEPFYIADGSVEGKTCFGEQSDNSSKIKSRVTTCVPVCSGAQQCLILCDPWTAAHQAPLSMGFFRQKYCSGLPLPPPGYVPNPGIKFVSPVSPAMQVDSLPAESSWKTKVTTWPRNSTPKYIPQENSKHFHTRM